MLLKVTAKLVSLYASLENISFQFTLLLKSAVEQLQVRHANRINCMHVVDIVMLFKDAIMYNSAIQYMLHIY